MVGLMMERPGWKTPVAHSRLEKGYDGWHLFLSRGETVRLRAIFEPVATKDEDRLQGTWLASRASSTASPLPERDLKNVRVAFAGRAVKIAMPDGFQGEGTFQLDSAKSPKRIDITRTEGKNRFAVPGIYSLEGDVLKLCVGEPEDLPTAFASQQGSRVIYFVLRRATAAELRAGK